MPDKKKILIRIGSLRHGGAEKVLRVFTKMYPEAPIYTLLADKEVAKNFPDRLHTSVIQKLPGGIKHYQWYMPFMPMAVEFFSLNEHDLVLSDASAFATGKSQSFS